MHAGNGGSSLLSRVSLSKQKRKNISWFLKNILM
jgi:hypothetical protein